MNDDEPLLIILGDTLFDADIQSLANATENVLYTYKVQDPRPLWRSRHQRGQVN